MKIQAPPGMRDFYPQDMRLQNWLFEQWRAVSEAHGFSEYEGPIFESLDLYTLKSGPEIVSQLFSFEDRGGRRLAIRPEMTPTLARMVAARAGALPRPVKWFSIPRMCRAEKPQRGRLREFFQWNVDVLGSDDPLADAEVLCVALEFFRRVGLSEQDVVLELNSRPLAAARLAALGVPDAEADSAFALIDRYDRLGPEEFRRQWDERLGRFASAARVEAEYLAAPDPRAGPDAPLSRVMDMLGITGYSGYCVISSKLVRGLDYYTGVVFEARARRSALRALLGGGRYDNLVGLLGTTPITGVGFGMGDVPVLELLRELDRLPALAGALDAYVVDARPELLPQALRVLGAVRRAGLSAEISYRRLPLRKQLAAAAQRHARFVLIIDADLTPDAPIHVKDMRTGEQRSHPSGELLADPPRFLAPRVAP